MNVRWPAILIASFLLLPACKDSKTTDEPANEPAASAEVPKTNLENYISENGLYIEKFDSTRLKDEHKYNEDNKLYLPDRIFVYDYMYYNEEGLERLCTILKTDKKIPGSKSWYFAPASDISEATITDIHITIIKGLGLLKKLKPDYNKTIAKFNYAYPAEMSSFKEQSGIVENEKNIMMTPPRFRIFRMLELCPYPFIQAPFEIGNKWTWERGIQSRWGDPMWGRWKGQLKNEYSYEITGKKRMDTAFGEMECYEIVGTATNQLGASSLTSYFHPDYGFIRMDYQTLFGTRMVLTLKAINQRKKES